jgi:hypothetical protein
VHQKAEPSIPHEERRRHVCSPRSARRVLVSLVATTAFLLTNAARAQEPQSNALVIAKRDDAVVTRLRHELSGLGLAPSLVVVDAQCSDALVSREMVARATSTALCVDEDGITVYGREGDAAAQREHEPWSSTPPSPSDLAIVQAAEAGRAQDFSLHAEAKDQAFVTSIQPEIDRLRPPPSPEHTGAETARALIRTGLGFFGSPIRQEPMLSGQLAVEARLHPRVSVVVSGEIPLLAIPFGSLVETRVGALEAGVAVPLTAPTSRFIPKLGVSTGIVALYSHSMLLTGRAETLVAPLVAVNAGLSMRLVGPVRVSLGGQLGAMTTRMTVFVSNTDVYDFGWLTYGLTSALEVQFL